MSIRYIRNIDDLYSTIGEFGGSYGNKPLKRIFSLVEREREYHSEECVSIIITEGYQDQEWSQEYEEYYKKMFIADREGITDTTTKLYFFIGKINDISELQSLDNSRFLGYIILRPLPTQKVCESIIKIPTEIYGLNHFIKCKEAFPSEIEDRQFEIEGFPFVQQDITTGVCAHACLRMVSLYLSKKYGTPSLSIPEINKICNYLAI